MKLTDVGLTKHKDDIGYSSVGSPVYMAPEVLLTVHSLNVFHHLTVT